VFARLEHPGQEADMTDTPSDRPPYPTQPGPPPGGGGAPRDAAPAPPRPPGAFLGLLAVLFGIIGLIRVNRGDADNRGQTVTGLITGAIAVLLGVVITISIGTWFATHVNDFNRFGRCIDNASGPTEREQCARQLSRELE
jgi:hypothetical protein